MESFHWDKHFETGLTEVDKQHHVLVDLINHFGELLTQTENVLFSDIEDVFSELATYAQYHFQEEESMMHREGLDSRFIESHKKLHVKFLHELTQMHEGFSPENHDTANLLLKFLIYWLAFHILGTDQSMSRQVTAIQSGQNSEKAYLDEARMKESSTEPLLIALNGLFQQVSERNHKLLELNLTLEKKVDDRTHALSDANHELTELVNRLEIEKEESRRLTNELAAANQRLKIIALTDVLTGLPNRRHALASLADDWSESVRDDTPLACMMIDADGFKQINDNYGHDAGDEVLRQLSQNLRYSVRTDDIVCRLGGDEFLIICPRTSLEGALLAAELTRQAVAALRVSAGKGIWTGSISVGVAVRTPEMRGPEDLLKAADAGVYIAKRNGRNRVACNAADAEVILGRLLETKK